MRQGEHPEPLCLESLQGRLHLQQLAEPHGGADNAKPPQLAGDVLCNPGEEGREGTNTRAEKGAASRQEDWSHVKAAVCVIRSAFRYPTFPAEEWKTVRQLRALLTTVIQQLFLEVDSTTSKESVGSKMRPWGSLQGSLAAVQRDSRLQPASRSLVIGRDCCFPYLSTLWNSGRSPRI